MHSLQQLRSMKLDGNERTFGVLALVVVVLVSALLFRPGPADVIPLGDAPGVMTAPSPPPRAAPTPPRERAEQLVNVPTGPWLALGANMADPGSVTTPVAQSPEPNWAWIGQGCAPTDPYRVDHCYELAPAAGRAPERTILTVGNSHSVQFTAAFLETADRRPSWVIRAMAAPGCPFTYVTNPKNECEHLWTTATQYIRAEQPDLVVVLATRSDSSGHENLLPGLAEWIKMIEDSTTSEVVAIRDTPRFETDLYECALDRGPADRACVVTKEYDPISAHRAELEAAGATYIDVTHQFCPNERCQPVVGGLWTYLDDNHPSADYWRTLAGYLSMRIHSDPNLRWWPPLAYLGDVIERPKTEVKPVV